MLVQEMALFRKQRDMLRYQYGYVLKGLREQDFVKKLAGLIGLEIYVGEYGIKKGIFYVKPETLIPCHEDMKHPNDVTYDCILFDEVYKFYYQDEKTDREKSCLVYRDILCEWYARIFNKSYYTYDLMRVPRDLLGPLQDGHATRTLSWQSSLLHPGLTINMEVLQSDIRYVPVSSVTPELFVEETSECEPYVNINLSQEVCMIRYKAKETGWKTKTELVDKEPVMKDYLESARAEFSHQSVKDWMAGKKYRVVL